MGERGCLFPSWPALPCATLGEAEQGKGGGGEGEGHGVHVLGATLMREVDGLHEAGRLFEGERQGCGRCVVVVVVQERCVGER